MKNLESISSSIETKKPEVSNIQPRVEHPEIDKPSPVSNIQPKQRGNSEIPDIEEDTKGHQIIGRIVDKDELLEGTFEAKVKMKDVGRRKINVSTLTGLHIAEFDKHLPSGEKQYLFPNKQFNAVVEITETWKSKGGTVMHDVIISII